MPGFSDSRSEVKSLLAFLDKTKVDMIQWRNLNYDPAEYFRKLKVRVDREDMLGIRELIHTVKDKYPHLMHGYFNPSKSRIRRSRIA